MHKQICLNKKCQKNTSGFTILEVLIAVTISLILLAGVLQIFLNSKNIYNQEIAFAQVQENGRFAIEYLPRVIRLAGYRSPPTSGTFATIADTFSATAYVTGTNGTGFNGTDTLSVSYQGSGNGTGTPDGSVRDCLNQGIDSGTIATSTFSINNNFELQCQASNANATPTSNTQVLVTGVESFHVLYGEDVDGDNAADRYVPASFPTLDMTRVVAVRLSLLLRSDTTLIKTPQSMTYYLSGTTYTPASTNYLRQQITFTVVLRNLLNSPV